MPSKELQMLIELIRSRPTREGLSIEEQRAAMEATFAQFQLAEDVKCEAVDAGGVPAEWVTAPEAVEERAIYYLHGGGYMMCSIATHREMAGRLSRAAAARVLLIDYRLAPENPFPAAVEDSLSGYRWLLSTGVDPAQVVITGESRREED